MNSQPTFVLDGVARVSIAAGTAIALAAAIAIAHATPAVRANTPVARTNAPVAAVEVVRLEPVVVTISASRYAAIRAETAAPMIGYQPVLPAQPPRRAGAAA